MIKFRPAPDIKIHQVQTLSDDWYVLKKTTYSLQDEQGEWHQQNRETYDRGNGATILLYNQQKDTIILTRQFRYPTYVNGNEDGMMIEACAGLLDQDDPISCIRKETEEETGYRITDVEKVAELYMSPGSVTEKLYFFLAHYDENMKTGEGGGIAEEQENIEVLEIHLPEAWQMVESGEIKDAKTILLMHFLHQKRTGFKS
jgi:nudix-type nucleoside diphosphatase (YffH/AdpP family)